MAGGSVHSYEEIAASELGLGELGGDLSPVYEEIPGGSRSSVSSGSSGGSPRGKFYYAAYGWEGEDSVSLGKLAAGQVSDGDQH